MKWISSTDLRAIIRELFRSCMAKFHHCLRLVWSLPASPRCVSSGTSPVSSGKPSPESSTCSSLLELLTRVCGNVVVAAMYHGSLGQLRGYLITTVPLVRLLALLGDTHCKLLPVVI